jgi:TM2 domain-containing membrane protein YozV
MDKVWEIKNPEEYLKSSKAKRPQAPRVERNPARAYTLSLLLWGAGQSYNKDHGKALALQLLLLALAVGTVVAAIFNDRLLLFLQASHIPPSQSFLFVESLFFSILVFWVSIAGEAYRTAARSRSARFPGIQSQVYPCLCSLLFPGWGQFLNGQPVKGASFSVVSVFGFFALVSIPATMLFWPSLDASDTRFIVEAIFAAAVLYAPLILLLWLFSAYDALTVSLDELKKEPLWERIKAANNRRRTQGWVRGVFPHIRSTLVLMLVLLVLSLIISRTLPAGFYAGLLGAVSTALRRQGMIILPEIIDRAIPVIALMQDQAL